MRGRELCTFPPVYNAVFTTHYDADIHVDKFLDSVCGHGRLTFIVPPVGSINHAETNVDKFAVLSFIKMHSALKVPEL